MHEVVVPKTVAKQIRKLSPQFRDRVMDDIDRLSADPRPQNCRKLTGENLFRVRVGDYRIVYSVHDQTRRVIIVRVGHRREVYR